MRIHALQHVWFEDLAFIAQWACARKFPTSTTLLFNGQALPAHDAYDCLVVLGGPMNIYEEHIYPWLRQEKQFIESAIKHNKSVVGICLGAQLIADVLGGTVTKNKYKEIGWFPVQRIDSKSHPSLLSPLPLSFNAFHWHGDTFSIPACCKKIAENEACKNQAFQYADRVLGLQFHLEASKESVARLAAECKDEIVAGPYVQKIKTIKNNCALVPQANEHMTAILEKLATYYKSEERASKL